MDPKGNGDSTFASWISSNRRSAQIGVTSSFVLLIGFKQLENKYSAMTVSASTQYHLTMVFLMKARCWIAPVIAFKRLVEFTLDVPFSTIR